MKFQRRDGTEVPMYQQVEDQPVGLCLGLFHGRDDPDADMEDMGFAGPVIGPLNYVHTTYGTEVKIGATAEVLTKYKLDTKAYPFLGINKDGLIEYDGRYFGDWTVFVNGAKP